MTQTDLITQEVSHDGHFDLGKGYVLHLPLGLHHHGDLYFQTHFIKRANLADKSELRIFVVELLQRDINQTRLAEVLNLSRQTLHNYRESYRMFGISGLFHGYSPSQSKSDDLQRRIHVNQRRPGSKARELEALRRAKKAQVPNVKQDDLAWDGPAEAIYTLQETAIDHVLPSPPVQEEQPETPSIPEQSMPATVAEETTVLDASSTNVSAMVASPETISDTISDNNRVTNQSDTATPSPSTAHEKVSIIPYADNHGWEVTRYAGIFTVIMVLTVYAHWMLRIFRLFGNGWRLFMLFLFMGVSDTRSMEQMKHHRQDELGRLLGLKRLPALDTLWTWFHEVADLRRSKTLLSEFFAHQIRTGLVSTRFWFTDGHLLPYTGQDKVHAAWNTQRRMPMPGQTNMVTCDTKGRIVAFDIQEGHGDLRQRVLELGRYAQSQSLGTLPIQVFDREGAGAPFFSQLVKDKTPFISWEKNVNQEQLTALQETDFTDSTIINNTPYKILEQVKTYTYKPETPANTQATEHTFELRRVVMQNMHTNQRFSVLCWDADLQLSLQDIAYGMLNRWGKSENTFKHIQERHPYHYHPGFSVSDSEKQDIANPQIKALERQITNTQQKLAKLYKAHSKAKPSQKQDGSERINSLHKRLTDAIATEEAKLKKQKEDKAKLPERVDVSGLADYKTFKTIDNEGKNLFDFVTTSVWNARRLLLDLLEDLYANDKDRVDLLYAIFDCQGWIRSDENWVVVRMEPLQQPSRRYAQEQLCRKLMGLGAKIPGGKWLRIEVGDSPMR